MKPFKKRKSPPSPSLKRGDRVWIELTDIDGFEGMFKLCFAKATITAYYGDDEYVLEFDNSKEFPDVIAKSDELYPIDAFPLVRDVEELHQGLSVLVTHIGDLWWKATVVKVSSATSITIKWDLDGGYKGYPDVVTVDIESIRIKK